MINEDGQTEGTDRKIRDGDGRTDEQEVQDWKQMEA